MKDIVSLLPSGGVPASDTSITITRGIRAILGVTDSCCGGSSCMKVLEYVTNSPLDV